MWKLIQEILSSGIKTEPVVKQDQSVEKIGENLIAQVKKRLGRALAIRMVDAGSCNGCELEIQAVNNPYYNLERFGIHFVASPRHADMLLVTGPVTKNMQEALKKTYTAMPEPKLVVAIGDCAHCGGVFNDSYAVVGAVKNVIPVNYTVKGCPPKPMDILAGILSAIQHGKY